MVINENEVVKYIEPVFRFCVRRLNNRHDAEDLASEIMVHVLSGMKKYHIESLEKWVWRIARNRYARFIDTRNKRDEIPSESDFTDIRDDYDFVDEIIIADEYQEVFKYLHTLSSEYRNILVDYYIGQLPVKQIAGNYGLTETTVKWRLNASREKIKTRIGEHKMDMIYKRVNWNTTACNGNMDSNKYLYSQIARAICEAAYEKPLTVEEISLKTGIPAMYIEDELPRLIYGDAVVKDGNKYAANFIVLRLRDKQAMEPKFAPFIADIADYFAALFKEREADISKMDFYGSGFGMNRLGHIALPAALRARISEIHNILHLQHGPFPPRLDGGNGWFIVEETEDENEACAPNNSGCNAYGGGDDKINLYWMWICRYFYSGIIYRGLGLLKSRKIIPQINGDMLPAAALTDDDRVTLLQNNLIVKDGSGYKLNFAVFDSEQFIRFRDYFDKPDAGLDKLLAELIADIHKSFKAFVPKRLGSQINQWVTVYAHSIIGFAAEELINRGVLEKPDGEKPLTNGVFCVLGEYINV